MWLSIGFWPRGPIPLHGTQRNVKFWGHYYDPICATRVNIVLLSSYLLLGVFKWGNVALAFWAIWSIRLATTFYIFQAFGILENPFGFVINLWWLLSLIINIKSVFICTH